ncbi:hypothetical protein J2X65_004148 [Ancylobacter sp. 3268]|nr:hypothetical protein [Ancylobacter sp. 3268]
MPAEQPLRGQWLLIVLRGIEHHFHDAFDMAIGGDQAGNIHAEAAGDRGTDLFPVKHLAFDLAGLQNVFGQHMDDFLAKREAKCLHAADQPPLSMSHGREALDELLIAPVQIRPVSQTMDTS